MRRLTRFEYDNTVRDLVGDASSPAKDFPAEPMTDGFDNAQKSQLVNDVHAEHYLEAAEAIAARAVTKLSSLLACDVATVGADACGAVFIRDFGGRVMRRPLSAAELERFNGFFASANAQYGFEDAIRMTFEALLQSPRFLYRLEEASGTGQAPDDFSLASRLSYLIWGTMPDPELLQLAGAGALSDPSQVALQAERMIVDQRARLVLDKFHTGWLGLGGLDRLYKDTSRFPTYSPEVGQLMARETLELLAQAFASGETLGSVLTGSNSYVNGTLASFYGLIAAPGNEFSKVDLSANHRAGLLTQPSLLTLHSKPDLTSPTLRGKFVRSRVLCGEVPAPPDGVPTDLPPPEPGLSTRDRLASHATNPSCSGCHSLMDPLGLAFESYDAVGAFRDTEGGLLIDSSGELSSSDVDGRFEGPAQLGSMLASSQNVSACLSNYWLQYALGREATADDACSMRTVIDSFDAHDHQLPDILRGLVRMDAFLYRNQAGVTGVTP